ncbi:MAG: hypothetical protein RM338_03905 [Nostoc sp. DedQUE12a]|nr:hypothetical protein [Nostoc sp. DedQUE12a]
MAKRNAQNLGRSLLDVVAAISSIVFQMECFMMAFIRFNQWAVRRWGILENLGSYHSLPHQDERHRRGGGCVSQGGNDGCANAKGERTL